jgi:hypothetical protein
VGIRRGEINVPQLHPNHDSSIAGLNSRGDYKLIGILSGSEQKKKKETVTSNIVAKTC